ncbi:hypothetical protein [Streptomyces adelaidensis]|nr:hypothetical protein [Streptomyces adelaidensis]
MEYTIVVRVSQESQRPEPEPASGCAVSDRHGSRGASATADAPRA